MYKNILLPIAPDSNRDNGAALNVARNLASPGGEITALTVVEPIPTYAMAYLPDANSEQLIDDIQAELNAELGGVQDVKPVVLSGHIGRTILAYAKDHDIDCIVVASHRPGLQDYVIGSTASYLVGHADCPVHVVR